MYFTCMHTLHVGSVVIRVSLYHYYVCVCAFVCPYLSVTWQDKQLRRAG